jgi:hypothetical protein
MLDTKFLETRMFRAVPGGYNFQFPPPSIFTPTDAVMVTETQKAEILAITRRGSPMARRIAFWAAIAVGTVMGHTVGTVPDMPTLGCAFVGFCAGFLTLIVAAQLTMWRKLVVLRPLLKQLPPSPELLFPREPVRMWTQFDWLHRGQGAKGSL